MLTDSKEFFVDLVSNASMDIYPDNTLSKFKNRLSQSVRLNGDWVVGVQEIFYPITFEPEKRNVTLCLAYVSYDQTMQAAGVESTIEYSVEERADVILERINTEMKTLLDKDEIVLKEDKTRKAPNLKIEGNHIVIWPGESTLGLMLPVFRTKDFLRVLGFANREFNTQYKSVMTGKQFQITGSSIPQLGTRSHLLFIYTDIIHDHFVGDCTARVLRVVPLSKGAYEGVGHITFTKPYYYPVRLDSLQTISIVLADENGNEIKFTDGRVYLSLHFMKKEVV